ncbi:MAG: 3-phosphoserine/phosphohydroxythreonine transaminase [Rhodothermales bacterium]|nr:3-phosphoserine/phosphohydroxythreonine transaminase [Rhodothermales bacterium]
MQTTDTITRSEPARKRAFNFSAGPGALPEAVLEEVREELPVYKSIGTSVLEISHRSPTYTEIAESARSLFRNLLGLGDEWHILFLQGGASLQFYQVPLNFLPESGTADYLVTGSWSKKALKEARFVGAPNVAASSEDEAFTFIPKRSEWKLDPKAAYLHFTSNNTIYGTQFAETPDVDVPLVCDASSDFMSRQIDVDRYGLIYAGAQKNIGPAGVTVVLIRDDFLARRNSPLPTLLDYGTHTAKLFHTPAVFAVYMVEKVLRWLDGLGGLAAMEDLNNRKARLLYERIDRTGFYSGTAKADSRSKMNVTFRLPNEELDAAFVKAAADRGLIALKGYRTVGGIRASIYNACPIEAVEALVELMDDFEKANG